MSKTKKAIIKILMTLFALLPFALGTVLAIVFKDVKWTLLYLLFLITNGIHITVLEKYGID